MKINHAMVVAVGILGTSVLALAAPANAAIVIGLQETGSTAVALTNTGLSSLTAFSFGTFTVDASGTAISTPFGLDSQTLATSNATPGVLSVYITETGISSPIGTLPFTSTFTGNVIPAGWSVQEQTFLDTGNGLFTVSGGTVHLLGNQTFSTFGAVQQFASIATGSLYSLTSLYTITATGVGTTNDTIDISAVSGVPEPSVWAMMLLGFGGIGFMMRGSRRNKYGALTVA